MMISSVKIDCSRIHDWQSFHAVFAEAFGFPSFYGRNMDAWIDCLSSLDVPEDGMTEIHCAPGTVLTMQLENVGAFRERYPEGYAALIECSAFVNFRRNEANRASVLALSFHR